MDDDLKEKLTLILLGRSGCGKGAQAGRILARWGAQGHGFSTGGLIRALIARYDNPTVRIARDVMERGALHPSWIAVFAWLKEMIEKGLAEKDLLFDGAPRRLWEARFLDEVMAWHKRPLPLCIYVKVSAAEATRRLLERGRADDTPAAIKNRMAYFPRHVLPVISYYKRRRRLIQVDGELPPDQVWRQIDAALGKRLKNQWPSR